jgi:DHA1 family inner membrane transport protein
MPNARIQRSSLIAHPVATRARIPPVAYLLTGSVAVIGSNSLVLSPIAPAVAASLATSVPAVMNAAAAFGLGTAASALFLGRHIDRLGARRMLQIALAALAAALALCAAAPSVRWLVAGQLLAGLASGVALPSIYTLAATVAPRGREGATIGVVLTGWTLSMVAGVSLSAVLADAVNWRAVHALVAALALAAAAALSLAGSAAADRRRAGLSPSPLAALAIPGVRPLLLACGVFMIGFYGTYGYLGDHLHVGLGRPVSAGGLAALAYGVGFGAAAFLDRAIDRFGARRALPAAFIAVAATNASLAAASASYAALLAVVAVWGLCNHIALNALVMRLGATDPARRGAIMGLNSAVTYLAVFAGTIAFGRIDAAFGFAALPVTAAALTLVAAWAARATDRSGRALRRPAACAGGAGGRCERAARNESARRTPGAAA